MAKDHGFSEAEKFPKVWTRGRREKRNYQRASGAISPLQDSREWNEGCHGWNDYRRCTKDLDSAVLEKQEFNRRLCPLHR